MRLAAVSLFFITFAVTAWVLTPPPPAESTLEPVTPLPPTPLPPDLPPELLDDEDLTLLNDCANDPEAPRECRVEAVHRLFTHYLRPPADAVRVSKVLRDPRWLAETDISRLDALAGWVPGNLARTDQPVFWVHLFRARDEPMARFLVRVSGLQRSEATPDDFRSFLRAEVTPAGGLQIEEFAWQDGYHERVWVEHYARERVRIYLHSY